jgi:membrane protease YdiL (CAAX protease family)
MGGYVTARKQHRSIVGFFALAYALSWLIEVPLALRAQGLLDVPVPFFAHYVAAYGPMISAIVVTGLEGGRRGLKDLLHRMFRWRVRLVWWVVALAPLLAYGVVAVAIRLMMGTWPDVGAMSHIAYLPDLGIGALIFWIVTFGLGEETGWRGFALPRLQEGRSALSATVVLWALWAVWHLPMFFYRYDGVPPMGFLLGLLAGAIILTWLYNSSEGSILLAGVWHGAFNFTTACVACGIGTATAVLSTLVMVWAVIVVIWFKPGTLSHSARQEVSIS